MSITQIIKLPRLRMWQRTATGMPSRHYVTVRMVAVQEEDGYTGVMSWTNASERRHAEQMYDCVRNPRRIYQVRVYHPALMAGSWRDCLADMRSAAERSLRDIKGWAA